MWAIHTFTPTLVVASNGPGVVLQPWPCDSLRAQLYAGVSPPPIHRIEGMAKLTTVT